MTATNEIDAVVAPMPKPAIKRGTMAALVVILASHLGLLLFTSTRLSICGDEGPHFAAGLAYLRWGEMGIYNLSPPLLRFVGAAPALLAGAQIPPAQPMLNLAPNSRHWTYYDEVESANFSRIHRMVVWGRWALIPLSLVACVIIFAWARSLYGDAGALLSATMWAFNPTVLANGSMLSTDVGLATSVLAAAWAWLRFAERPTPGRCILAAVLIAVAHATKFTALLLWPAIIGIALLYGGALKPKRKEFISAVLISLLVTWVFLNACYGFLHIGKRLDSLILQSDLMLAIKQIAPGGIRVPLAQHLIEGFDAQKFEAEGMFVHSLLGEGYFGMDWRFYPLAVVFKTPLGGLLVLSLLAVTLISRRPSRQEWALLILIITLYLGLTVLADLTSGLRYLLVLYPFAMILIGRLMSFAKLRYVACATALVAGIESIIAAPHFHAFYNVVARPYRMQVPDLGWGQSLLDLRDWMQKSGENSVTVFSTARTSPAVYGLLPGDARQPVTTEYVALHPVFLGGFPEKYKMDFVVFRPWRKVLATKPAVDFGGIRLYRTADVPGAAEGSMFAFVKSWTQAMAIPEIAPIRDYEDRVRKGR